MPREMPDWNENTGEFSRGTPHQQWDCALSSPEEPERDKRGVIFIFTHSHKLRRVVW